MTLKETLCVNGILTNGEIWYNLKKSELVEFEELDRCLLRKVFTIQISCPKEALHLESGTISISTLIKSRCINYLHYLVKEDLNRMLSQFFLVQRNSVVKNDWTKQVKLDLDDFDIPFDLESLNLNQNIHLNNL